MALGAMEKILYRVRPEATLGAIEGVSHGAGEAVQGLSLLSECRAAHPCAQASGLRATPTLGLLQVWPEQRVLRCLLV